MKNFRLFITVIMLVSGRVDLPGQLTFVVDALPSNTPGFSSFFVAGNFNGWQPGLSEYQLQEDSSGRHSITFSPSPGNLEFKFTRGTWESGEGNENGGFRPNRTYSYSGSADTILIRIAGWEDTGSGQSTAAGNVHIPDDSFHLPFLNRDRRIRIYLPPDYATSDKRYKVLYMQDGQNLFDQATSYAGEWEIDETLNRLFEEGDEGCIVVGVDNGGENRLEEYSPWPNIIYGGGKGDAYLFDLVFTIKPYIDTHYRTLPDRDHTGIMGSSMGGLISMYGGLKYGEVFSRIGNFSCSYWFNRDAAIDFIGNEFKVHPMRMYMIAGALEGGHIPEDALAMDSLLRAGGYAENEFSTTIHPDGAHGEWYWAREFEAAYRWLWKPSASAGDHVQEKPGIRMIPDPGKHFVTISSDRDERILAVRVLDIRGRLYLHFNGNPGSFPITSLPEEFVVRVHFDSGRIFSGRLVQTK